MSSKDGGKAKDEDAAAKPKFTEMERVPASRPYIDGLEEAYVKKLLERVDIDTTLSDMLEQEVMSVADARKRMEERRALHSIAQVLQFYLLCHVDFFFS